MNLGHLQGAGLGLLAAGVESGRLRGLEVRAGIVPVRIGLRTAAARVRRGVVSVSVLLKAAINSESGAVSQHRIHSIREKRTYRHIGAK